MNNLNKEYYAEQIGKVAIHTNSDGEQRVVKPVECFEHHLSVMVQGRLGEYRESIGYGSLYCGDEGLTMLEDSEYAVA